MEIGAVTETDWELYEKIRETISYQNTFCFSSKFHKAVNKMTIEDFNQLDEHCRQYSKLIVDIFLLLPLASLSSTRAVTSDLQSVQECLQVLKTKLTEYKLLAKDSADNKDSSPPNSLQVEGQGCNSSQML